MLFNFDMILIRIRERLLTDTYFISFSLLLFRIFKSKWILFLAPFGVFICLPFSLFSSLFVVRLQEIDMPIADTSFWCWKERETAKNWEKKTLLVYELSQTKQYWNDEQEEKNPQS